MATNIILSSHTYANSRLELNTVKKNDFEDAKTIQERKVKVLDYAVSIQPDIGADYGKTVRYFINTHTGLLSGKDLALYIALSASTVSAGVGSYCDGFLLNCIKKVRLMSTSREIYKMNAQAIYDYYQRASSERKTFLKAQARIGATGADVAIGTIQAGCILLPNPFQDFTTLKMDLLRDRPYFEIEFAPLSAILSSTNAGATLTGYIQSAYIAANYLAMSNVDKADVLKKTITQSEFIDYVDYNVPAGATTISVDIPFGESEYLGFYVADTTTHQPFTGISSISDYSLAIDNHSYPEIVLPARVQQLQQVQYFRKYFDSNVYTLRFSSVSSRDDEIEDNGMPYGSLVLRAISNPKFTVNFTAPLANNCTLHIMNFGRAWYKYQDGELVVESKN